MKLAFAIVAVCATAHADSSIARVACPSASAHAECFALTVPANRATPSAKTITIPIVRFRATSAHPLEPIVFLAGGPGVDAIVHLDRARRPYTDDHDFILFQQRGGKGSRPELACPEWTSDATQHRAQAAVCGKRIAAVGVDLDGFDTAEIVADLFDLQHALAIPTMDLFGVSYGTRVALEALRAAPSKTAIKRRAVEHDARRAVERLVPRRSADHGLEARLAAPRARRLANGGVPGGGLCGVARDAVLTADAGRE